jgi:predicted Fe-Mo cluster-binding NifX family protein
MKYALPTDDGATVGKVFGRATSFAIFDQADSSIALLKNDGINAEHGAGTGAASFLADKGVNVVIAPEVGPKAAAGLAAAGIKVVSAAAGASLRAAVDSAIAG